MIIEDQRSRLTQWFDYLTSDEASAAPAAFRYWAFAEMLKLGSFDEQRKTFNKRTESTAATFSELNQQALAMVFDEIARRREGEPSHIILGTEEDKARFRNLLQSENFGRLYDGNNFRPVWLPERVQPESQRRWAVAQQQLG